MHVSQLSKDNRSEKVRKHVGDEDLINVFLGVLDEFEFARFAAGDENEKIDKVYTSSLSVISKMENIIKH